jgi:hypothetical protein
MFFALERGSDSAIAIACRLSGGWFPISRRQPAYIHTMHCIFKVAQYTFGKHWFFTHTPFFRLFLGFILRPVSGSLRDRARRCRAIWLASGKISA